MEIGVFVLFGLVALAGAYAAYYFRKKRREELAAMAFRLGLEFSSDDPFGCLTYPFALLTKGDGRGAENVMWGTWQNMPVREFDYWYYEESTDSNGNRSRTYHRFSCAVTEIDAACSHLTIDRENLFTALADHIGLHDIEFESADFNRAFNVKSKDRKFANDIVDARMMHWLQQTDGGFHFEVCGKWLLAFGKKRRPDDLIPLLGTLQQFRDHVPRVVYELYPVA
jgi:LPXTG-motif cell wall-anchored protein